MVEVEPVSVSDRRSWTWSLDSEPSTKTPFVTRMHDIQLKSLKALFEISF
jgi:hypothetical protein